LVLIDFLYTVSYRLLRQ